MGSICQYFKWFSETLLLCMKKIIYREGIVRMLYHIKLDAGDLFFSKNMNEIFCRRRPRGELAPTLNSNINFNLNSAIWPNDLQTHLQSSSTALQ